MRPEHNLLVKDEQIMPKTTIQINQKFARLTVIAFHHKDLKSRIKMWECRCECGNTVIVGSAYLKNGNTRSCGCLQRDKLRNLMTVHGMCGSPEYLAWQGMKRRTKSTNKRFAQIYKDRGIVVCREWESDFESFFAHVGKMPSPKHTLDRIDGTKGYEPGNVRWATHAEQNRNTSRNIWITFQDTTLCLADWARRLNVDPGIFRYRINHWPVERAMLA